MGDEYDDLSTLVDTDDDVSYDFGGVRKRIPDHHHPTFAVPRYGNTPVPE